MGRAATAAASVAYSPDVFVPARTIKAPDGGVVRDEGGESAATTLARARLSITLRCMPSQDQRRVFIKSTERALYPCVRHRRAAAEDKHVAAGGNVPNEPHDRIVLPRIGIPP